MSFELHIREIVRRSLLTCERRIVTARKVKVFRMSVGFRIVVRREWRRVVRLKRWLVMLILILPLPVPLSEV